MKFKSVEIEKGNYNKVILSWIYQPILLEETNFIIRISHSGVKEGPWQVVKELAYNVVQYEHDLLMKRWQWTYFKIEIVDDQGNVDDFRIVELPEFKDVTTNAIRKKYDLYLRKRIKNPIKVFKKKKVGNKCRECWDPLQDVQVKSDCSTCFGTGIGNDNYYGFSNLLIDGWLKKNQKGQLQFFKRDMTFKEYPGIGNYDDFGVKVGDDFIISNQDDEIQLTLTIEDIKENSLYLNYDETVYNYLENAKFSVRGLELKDKFELEHKMLQSEDQAGFYFYIKNLDLTSLDFDTIKFENADVTYPVQNLGDFIFIESSSVSADLSFTLLKTIDYGVDAFEVVAHFELEKYLYSDFEKTYLFGESVSIEQIGKKKIIIEYNYDGVTDVIFEGKRYIISNSTGPHRAIAGFTLINAGDQDGVSYAELSLVGLKDYIIEEDNPFTYNFIMNRVFKGFIFYKAFDYVDRYALFSANKILKPHTQYFLPPQEILGDTFSGCGILLIDVIAGKNYYGERYDPTPQADHFTVDEDLTWFNTRDLPASRYELNFIYNVKNIEFSSYFIPKDYDIYNGDIRAVEWIFKHPLFEGKSLMGQTLSVDDKDMYRELIITEMDSENGKVTLESQFDSNFFYDALTEGARFNIVESHTGGYYQAIDSWINYLGQLEKKEILQSLGISTDNYQTSLTYFYPRLEPDDLIFDVKTKIFYNVMSVQTPYLRRSELSQRSILVEAGPTEQNTLFSLLNR